MEELIYSLLGILLLAVAFRKIYIAKKKRISINELQELLASLAHEFHQLKWNLAKVSQSAEALNEIYDKLAPSISKMLAAALKLSYFEISRNDFSHDAGANDFIKKIFPHLRKYWSEYARYNKSKNAEGLKQPTETLFASVKTAIAEVLATKYD
jgi:hypothetical protein